MIDTPTCLGKKDGYLHDHNYRKKLLNQLISWTTNGNMQDLRYPTPLAYVFVYFSLSKAQWTLPVPTRLVHFLFCFYAKKKKKKITAWCVEFGKGTPFLPLDFGHQLPALDPVFLYSIFYDKINNNSLRYKNSKFCRKTVAEAWGWELTRDLY